MTRSFTLAGLLRVRELQEERAAAGLAHANHLRDTASRDRAALEHALALHDFPVTVEELDGELVGHDLKPSASTWRALVAARAAATALLRESTDALQIATAEADVAADEWAQAKMRAAMIHKLQDRHNAALVSEELREEQLTLDEAALRRSLEVTP